MDATPIRPTPEFEWKEERKGGRGKREIIEIDGMIKYTNSVWKVGNGWIRCGIIYPRSKGLKGKVVLCPRDPEGARLGGRVEGGERWEALSAARWKGSESINAEACVY